MSKRKGSPKRQNSIEKFFTLLKQPQLPRSQKAVAVREFTVLLSQFAAAILSSLVASWLAQDILRNNFPLVVVIGFTLLFLFTTLLQTRWGNLRLSAYKLFVTMLTLIVVEGILLAWVYVTTLPPTVYIIVDATEQTQDIFSDIIKNVKYATTIQPSNTLIGMRIYGGNLVNNSDCDATQQFIKPTPQEDYAKQVSTVFENLEPRGHASLTVAVLQTLRDDLKSQRGAIKLVVITSGIDTECELPITDGSVFEEIAKEKRSDISIEIISVGELLPAENSALDSYAKAYDGVHINTTSINSLPLLIFAPPSYFVDYPERVDSTPTP